MAICLEGEGLRVKSSIVPPKTVVHCEQKATGFTELNWADYVLAGETFISTVFF
jgi:hypothetical protein